MASIIERQGGFTVRWLADGVWQGWFCGPDRAEAEACKWFVEERAARGNLTYARVQGGQVDVVISERRYLNVTEDDLGPVDGPRRNPEAKTLGQVWAAMMRERRVVGRGGTAKRSADTADAMGYVFAKHFADWSDKPAHLITPQVLLDRYVALVAGERGYRALKPSTASRNVGYVVDALRYGFRLKLIKGVEPDFDRVKAILENQYVRPHQVLTPEQHDVVQSLVCDADTEALIIALDASGVRIGEAHAWCVGDINLAKRIAAVNFHMVRGERRPGTKTGPGKTRKVPLNERAVQALAPYVEGRPASAPLFTNTEGNYWNYQTWYKTRWEKLRDAVDASPDITLVDYDGKPVRLLPHIFRHGFATRMAQQGLPLFQLKDILGHASVRTVEIYYHADNEQAAQAAVEIYRRAA